MISYFSQKYWLMSVWCPELNFILKSLWIGSRAEVAQQNNDISAGVVWRTYLSGIDCSCKGHQPFEHRKAPQSRWTLYARLGRTNRIANQEFQPRRYLLHGGVASLLFEEVSKSAIGYFKNQFIITFIIFAKNTSLNDMYTSAWLIRLDREKQKLRYMYNTRQASSMTIDDRHVMVTGWGGERRHRKRRVDNPPNLPIEYYSKRHLRRGEVFDKGTTFHEAFRIMRLIQVSEHSADPNQ